MPIYTYEQPSAAEPGPSILTKDDSDVCVVHSPLLHIVGFDVGEQPQLRWVQPAQLGCPHPDTLPATAYTPLLHEAHSLLTPAASETDPLEWVFGDTVSYQCVVGHCVGAMGWAHAVNGASTRSQDAPLLPEGLGRAREVTIGEGTIGFHWQRVWLWLGGLCRS